MMAFSFPNLSRGEHRITVGSLNKLGQFLDENSYCFTVPGSRLWSGPDV